MEAKFQISEVLATSWKALKSQIWVLVGLFIGYTIISGIVSSFTSPANPQDFLSIRSIIGWIIALIIGSLFSMGYIKNLFQTLDGIEPQFSAYGQQAPKLVTFIIANIIYSIIVIVGLIIFIIPGIYLAIRLQFFMVFIVQEDAGIMESLRMSWNITKGNAMQLFLLGLAMIGITIVGLILLIVGVFVAGPLCYMMYCYAFRKLYANPLQLTTEEA